MIRSLTEPSLSKPSVAPHHPPICETAGRGLVLNEIAGVTKAPQRSSQVTFEQAGSCPDPQARSSFVRSMFEHWSSSQPVLERILMRFRASSSMGDESERGADLAVLEHR